MLMDAEVPFVAKNMTEFQLERWLVGEGDEVKAGQTICQLSARARLSIDPCAPERTGLFRRALVGVRQQRTAVRRETHSVVSKRLRHRQIDDSGGPTIEILAGEQGILRSACSQIGDTLRPGDLMCTFAVGELGPDPSSRPRFRVFAEIVRDSGRPLSGA